MLDVEGRPGRGLFGMRSHSSTNASNQSYASFSKYQSAHRLFVLFECRSKQSELFEEMLVK